MPRRSRKLVQSGVYHVMLRGIEKKNIFIDDEDKQRIMHTIIEKRELEGFKLNAYCIMDNHIHLLIKEEKETVSQTVKRIGTSYAYYFNKKYDRIGHLFQDRFKSEPIKDDVQMLAVVRYIHNNPVKAGMVENAKDYEWSSYRIYCSSERYAHRCIQGIVRDVEEILSIYSPDIMKAQKAFIKSSNEMEDDIFIDFDISDKEIDIRKNKKIIEQYLEELKLEKSDLKKNSQKLFMLVKKLKEDEGISLRQIAEILRLSRGLVQRTANSNVSK